MPMRGTRPCRRRCCSPASANGCCGASCRPAPGDVVVDLGCGSGRSLVWNLESGASMVGIDVAPYFAGEALEGADLVLGDLRRLPFADGTFAKAYALDVFEHLSKAALADVLAEMARVMRPGGHLFLYSHVRKNSWLAHGLKGINAHRRGGSSGSASSISRRSGCGSPIISTRSRTSPISRRRCRRPDSGSRASATTRRSSAPSSRTSSCGWPSERSAGERARHPPKEPPRTRPRRAPSRRDRHARRPSARWRSEARSTTPCARLRWR